MKNTILVLLILFSVAAWGEPWSKRFLEDLGRRGDLQALSINARGLRCKADFEPDLIAAGAMRIFELMDFEPTLQGGGRSVVVETSPREFIDPNTGKRMQLRWQLKAWGSPTEIWLQRLGGEQDPDQTKELSNALGSVLLTLSYDDISKKTEISNVYTAPVEIGNYQLPPREVRGRLPRSLQKKESKPKASPPSSSRCSDPDGHFDFAVPSGWKAVYSKQSNNLYPWTLESDEGGFGLLSRPPEKKPNPKESTPGLAEFIGKVTATRTYSLPSGIPVRDVRFRPNKLTPSDKNYLGSEVTIFHPKATLHALVTAKTPEALEKILQMVFEIELR